MRPRHEGPGVGRHQALGVKELGSPTRRNPTLRPSLGASDAATTRRRRGAHERLPTTHIAWRGLRVPDLVQRLTAAALLPSRREATPWVSQYRTATLNLNLNTSPPLSHPLRCPTSTTLVHRLRHKRPRGFGNEGGRHLAPRGQAHGVPHERGGVERAVVLAVQVVAVRVGGQAPGVHTSDVTLAARVGELVPVLCICTSAVWTNPEFCLRGGGAGGGLKPKRPKRFGRHWLKQWTVGGRGRGEQARLEPTADIAT